MTIFWRRCRIEGSSIFSHATTPLPQLVAVISTLKPCVEKVILESLYRLEEHCFEKRERYACAATSLSAMVGQPGFSAGERDGRGLLLTLLPNLNAARPKAAKHQTLRGSGPISRRGPQPMKCK